MAESCSTIALSLQYPKTVQELGVGVIGSSYPSRCLIRTANVCFAGSQDLYLDINQTKIVTCDNTLSCWWEVTYLEYLSEYAVRVQICRITEEDDEPDPTPPPVGEVDYDRIESDTAAIVDDATSIIQADVSDVGAAVAGVDAAIQVMDIGLTGRIADLTGHITGLISDLSEGLGNRIDGMTDALTGGLAGLGEKIDGLQFPTLETIKQGFLDTCADLAIALWDSILDKIEERYPDDEEESD